MCDINNCLHKIMFSLEKIIIIILIWWVNSCFFLMMHQLGNSGPILTDANADAFLLLFIRPFVPGKQRKLQMNIDH